MTGVKSGTLIVSYSVGSRYEPAPISGVSHFLEHMLFKGTERRPDPKQISEEIEGVGGVLNAATSREGTSYWFKAPSSHFAPGYDVLADIVRNSVDRRRRARQGALRHPRGDPLHPGLAGRARPRRDRRGGLGRPADRPLHRRHRGDRRRDRPGGDGRLLAAQLRAEPAGHRRRRRRAATTRSSR